MNRLALLLKREYWEHRGGFLWTPVWISAAILAVTVLGIISAEIFGQRADVHIGIALSQLRDHLDAAGLENLGNALDVSQLVFAAATSIGLSFVTFFYLLGALYDDRRDRSVLFWKSLPVSDAATVVSKALTAMFVIPVIALVVATLAYVAFLVVQSLWATTHGINPLPAIAAAHPLGMFARLVAAVPLGALWALPTVGWLLFWSAFSKSKPFMWAVLLPIVVLFANGWLGLIGAPHVDGSNVRFAAILGRLLLSVIPGSWFHADAAIAGTAKISSIDGDHIVSAFDPSNTYALLGSLNLWIGVIVGLALLAAAVWLRGRRVETNS